MFLIYRYDASSSSEDYKALSIREVEDYYAASESEQAELVRRWCGGRKPYSWKIRENLPSWMFMYMLTSDGPMEYKTLTYREAESFFSAPPSDRKRMARIWCGGKQPWTYAVDDHFVDLLS